MSTDYEKKYNSLKQEYDQYKLDNDEICKEYESYIKELTESVENFKKEKTNLESQVSQLVIEQKNLEKEKDSLLSKNKDKISDIQNLNKQIDKLKSELKKIKEEKNLVKDKIIALETDNDHYQNKLRQDEALIEDLNSQLESALEENITLQTEFELYKQHNEETLIRKDQEIKDFQNDIINKEKIIQRLNDKRFNNLKELKQKLLIPQDILKQYQTKIATSMREGNLKDNSEKNQLSKTTINDKINNSNLILDKMITPIAETNPQYPPKFMEIYRKSLNENSSNSNNITNQTEQNNSNNNTNLTTTHQDKDKNITNENNKDNLLLQEKNSDNIFNDNNNPLLRVTTLKEGSIENGDIEGLELDEKNNKEENEEEDSTGSDKKVFEDLVICDEKDFHIIPIKKLMNENKKNRDKKLVDNLRNMLARIQKRKEVLIKNQKNNNLKLAKLGYKLEIKL